MTDEQTLDERIEDTPDPKTEEAPSRDIRLGYLVGVGVRLFGEDVVRREMEQRGYDWEKARRCMDAVTPDQDENMPGEGSIEPLEAPETGENVE